MSDARRMPWGRAGSGTARLLGPLLALLGGALGASADEGWGATPTASGREIPMSRPEWRLRLPTGYEPRPGGAVDLLVHFHGDPPTVWSNVDRAGLNVAVVTANYPGLSSAYRVPFSDPGLLQVLLDDALGRLREEPDLRDARWGRIAVSSFSAGYGAVREILKRPEYRDVIDALLAADSLYASTDETDGTPVDEQLDDYETFARLAVRGEKTFVFTHTEVPTPTYESTRETADELLERLGLEAEAIGAEGPDAEGMGPLRFVRRAGSGRFQLWGSPGVTGDEHMDHLRHMAEWLDELGLARRKADTH